MKIGASWRKEGQESGKKYLSCVIELPFVGKINFAMFPNTEKKEENQPDYNIVWSPPKENRSGGRQEPESYDDPFTDDFPI